MGQRAQLGFIPKTIKPFMEFLDENPAAKLLANAVDDLSGSQKIESLAYLAYAFQVWVLENTIRQENEANRRMSDNLVTMMNKDFDDLKGMLPR